MKILQTAIRRILLTILLFSYSVGFCQSDSTRLDQKAISFFDSIALKLDSNIPARERVFIGGSPFFGQYKGTAILGSDEDKAAILSIPIEFIKLNIKIYGFRGYAIKVYENQDYYYHAGSGYFDKTGIRVESKETLDRLQEYDNIYHSLLPILFQ